MVARTATVTGILTRPGTTQPWGRKKGTFALNTPAFTADGTTEKHGVGDVTTGLDGSWSKTFEINDDLTPAGTWYTVQFGSTRWAFQLVAADAGQTRTLLSVLVAAPGNTQPVQAGASTAALAATNANVATNTAAIAALPSTYDPLLTMAADGSLSFAVASAYGVDSSGQPYQNPAGATAGEGAYLTFDPSDGSPVLIPLGA